MALAWLFMARAGRAWWTVPAESLSFRLVMKKISPTWPGIFAIAEPLVLPLQRTNADIAPEHGHMGAADDLVPLGLHLERGDLAAGDVVAMCGPSTGMHWCCTLIQV